jgi:hypothetical protein
LNLYETGGLTTEEFVDAIRLAGPRTVERRTGDRGLELYFYRHAPRTLRYVALLTAAVQRYFCSAISMTLHATWIDDYMLREHGITDFQSRYFDGVYYSHLIRLRKPDREIYEYVLADAEILPQETLFIDDLEENVKAAREVGIQGVVKRQRLMCWR